jgi:IclR family acetate operon transcriptional repressor
MSEEPIKQTRNRLTTAEKVVLLLKQLAASPSGLRLREVARTSGIDKSAVSRIFDELMRLNMVVWDDTSSRYCVGSALYALAATVHGRDTLWLAAQPFVHRLATQFNETVYLTVREADEVVFRERVDTSYRLRYVIETGDRSPLHAGAAGRAVLMTLPPEEIRRLLNLPGRLEALTAHTIVNVDELVALATRDRLRGYAISHGERTSEGVGIAAPFFNSQHEALGAIAFTCPASRFRPDLEAVIAAEVIQAAREVSQRLGWNCETG